ncbi:hypothetical protein LTR78_001534 [Recurvomyces mirabilis]|uniref:Actin-like ATPase domain-containing protein n=1 Tax=Recurvomyces mirabilis TaxID=574656 RepID=A0AAE1C5M2_9PEZI|nr:hypothetical protein LTR78_001534 [Recurvomyces mirabilis]KAK5161512.1 hypothetical protein LTS14_001308 [Recurvomyces mirabilis]
MPEPSMGSQESSTLSPFEDNYLSRNVLDDEDGYEEDAVPELPSPVINPPTQASPSATIVAPKSRPSVRHKPDLLRREKPRFILALDFGTTFTGIAFASTNASRGHLPEITVLQNWTKSMSNKDKVQDWTKSMSNKDKVQDWTKSMSNKDKVPSVISYSPPEHDEVQWGSDISKDAITMVNQKLELELQDTVMDELDMTLYVLRGTKFLSFDNICEAGPKPAFSPKTTGEVITDYLAKIFQCAKEAINSQQIERTKTPIDLVVTTPVCWSYKAHNAMFRAVKEAGFSTKFLPTLQDTILVSEPEAAAYFAALAVKDQGDDFLQQGQTFVLCDAGGGTVDTVSYQVKSVTPFLELERMTAPSGRKCGSALIDLGFKTWLRDIIGPSSYAELDPVNAYQHRINPHTAETGEMRELIRRFIVRKIAFSNNDEKSIKIDLPAPLNTLTIAGRIEQGGLTLTWFAPRMTDMDVGYANLA